MFYELASAFGRKIGSIHSEPVGVVVESKQLSWMCVTAEREREQGRTIRCRS